MPSLNKPQRIILSLIVPILSIPIAGELILLFYKPTRYIGRMIRTDGSIITNGVGVTREWNDVLLDYPPAIISFVIFVLMLELYLWRTIQPGEDKSFFSQLIDWSKRITIKKVGLLFFHIIASVSIPLMLFSNHAFQARYDVEQTSLFIFCCYWVLVVIIRAVRRAGSNLPPSTSDNTELNDSPDENIQTNSLRPNVFSLIDEPEHKRFGGDIEKIENMKVTRREDKKSNK